MNAERRLNVHHLITKLELGGAQQNTLYCVRHHDRSRFSVTLGAGPGGILDREAAAIPRAAYFRFNSLRREIRPHLDLGFTLAFARFLRANRIHILHTHSSKAGILGRLAAWIARTPVVVHTIHGWGFHDFQPRLSRMVYIALERWAAPRTDLLIAVSRENMERGIREGIGERMQYRIIRSGIEASEFAKPRRARGQVRKSLSIPAKAPLVITVGNFKPQKAPLDFVRAAAVAGARIPSAYFLMLGDGELRGKAEKLAAKLGMRSRIIFAGWRRDVPDLLHASDLFALSSLFEGLPRSVLQAQAAGLPVVATRAGGTPEAVREGESGYLVKPGDYRSLAGAVCRLLRNRKSARRFGRSGKEHLGKEFAIGKMIRDIEKEYLEAARRAGLG